MRDLKKYECKLWRKHDEEEKTFIGRIFAGETIDGTPFFILQEEEDDFTNRYYLVRYATMYEVNKRKYDFLTSTGHALVFIRTKKKSFTWTLFYAEEWMQEMVTYPDRFEVNGGKQ